MKKIFLCLIIYSWFLFDQPAYSLTSIDLENNYKFYKFAISSDSKHIIFTNNKSIKVLDLISNKISDISLPDTEQKNISNLFIGSKNSFLLALDENNIFKILDLKKNKELFSISKNYIEPIYTIFNHDNSFISIQIVTSNKIKIYDLKSKDPIFSIILEGSPEVYKFTPDGKNILLMELTSPALKEYYKKKEETIITNTTNNDTLDTKALEDILIDSIKTLHNITEDLDNKNDNNPPEELTLRMSIWNLKSKKNVYQKELIKTKEQIEVFVDNDNLKMALKTCNSIEIREILSNKLTNKFDFRGSCRIVSFSPDNKYLIAVISGDIIFWDLSKNEKFGLIRSNDSIKELMFTNDSNKLVGITENINNKMVVWNLPNDIENIDLVNMERQKESKLRDEIYKKYPIFTENFQPLQYVLETYAVYNAGNYPKSMIEVEKFIEKIKINWVSYKNIKTIKNPYNGKKGFGKNLAFDDYSNYKKSLETKGTMFYKPIECKKNKDGDEECKKYSIYFSNEKGELMNLL